MNKRKIKNLLRDESRQLYSNVYDNILDTLQIEKVDNIIKPWWKSFKFLFPVSVLLVTSFVIGIFAISNNNLIESALINMTIDDKISTFDPSFSYSLDNNNISKYFIAKNDNAKIIAEGIDSNIKRNGSDGVTLTKEIIKQASKTGYLDNISENNIISVQITSSSFVHKEKLKTKLNSIIKESCIENYIYASITIEEIDIETQISEEKYEKISQIYELAHLLQSYSEDTNEEISKSDFIKWIDAFKVIDNSELDLLIEKLNMINQALTSDIAKEKFKTEIDKIKCRYIMGIKELKLTLKDIQNKITDTINYLIDYYDFNFENTYGVIEYPKIPVTKEGLFEDLEWLLKINNLDDFNKNYDDFYYAYDDSYDPFYDCFDYSWDYEKQEHKPPKHVKGPIDDGDDKQSKIDTVNILLDAYRQIVANEFDIYYQEYQYCKYRILANIYYQVNEQENNVYHVDYNKEYNDRKDHYGHHPDDNTWNAWKDVYDTSWWDYH